MARINTVKTAEVTELPLANKPDEVKPVVTTDEIEVFDSIELPKSARAGGKSKYKWNETPIGGGFFVPGGEVKTFYTLCSNQSKKSEDVKFIARKWTSKNGVEGVMVFKRPKD